MAKFAFVKLFVRIGPWLALLLAAVMSALGWWGVIQFEWHWMIGVIAVAAGLVAGFLLMVFVDLTRVLMEMLVPQ